MSYDPGEQDEIIAVFSEMLKAATWDGGRKRNAGLKPSWKVDPSHLPAVFSHLNKWYHGERKDRESGAHPFVHAAWRLLAIAWQDEEAERKALKAQDCPICGLEAGRHYPRVLYP